MTIGDGRLRAQLNTIWKILILLGLEMDRIERPDYSDLSASTLRGLSYSAVWRKCIEEGMYDFKLDDGAFFQFYVDRSTQFEARYSYYECPYGCVSYRDYVTKHLDLRLETAGDLFMEDYGHYVLGCAQKESVTPIRYDYKPAHYIEGRHPASHVHFGHLNDVRVATRRLLAPLSFFLLIVRQHYPDSWAGLLTHNEASHWCRNVRDELEAIDTQYWNPRDRLEMALD